MGSVMVRQSDNQQRGSYLRACLRLCLLFMAGVVFWVLLVAGSAGPGMLATPVAKAVPAYQHSAAESCTSCHHRGSVASCSTCHEQQGLDANLANQSCTSCHSNKQAPDRTCWSCHKPGEAQPEPTDAACQLCHTVTPHLAATATCTTSACHGGAVTPHHDGQEQNLHTDCTYCHADKPKPAAGRSCQTCHKGAQHQAQPQVGSCSSCHGTGRARHAGKVACTTCHGDPNKTHHNRIPSPPSCTSCHEQQLHDGRVPCVWCHGSKAMHDSTPLNLLTLSAAKSQNKKGSARDRVCTQCHVEATAHAGDTPAGVDHSCATCHEGEVHGPITSPEVQRCMDCHGAADKHALQHDCKRCHWPAIHNGTPDAGVGGGQKKMKLYLPAGSAGGVTDSGRTRLVDTGADLIPIALAGILLLGSGIYLRKKRL